MMQSGIKRYPDIDDHVDDFMKLIALTPEYRNYERMKNIISQDSDLKDRVDKLRMDNFMIQHMTDDRDVYDRIDELEKQNDDILDKKMLAMDTIHVIQDLYPGLLEHIYESGEVNPNGMLKAVAVKRHFKKEDDVLDIKRAAESFLNDLRHGKLGRLTLEKAGNEEDRKTVSE